MDEVEILSDTKRVNHIPNAVKYIGGTILTINALYLGLWGLGLLGQIFGVSMAAGIIMLLTSIGLFSFAPMWIGFTIMGWIDELDTTVSRFEYWTKTILLSIASIVVPYIAYFITAYILLVIAVFITSFAK